MNIERLISRCSGGIYSSTYSKETASRRSTQPRAIAVAVDGMGCIARKDGKAVDVLALDTQLSTVILAVFSTLTFNDESESPSSFYSDTSLRRWI